MRRYFVEFIGTLFLVLAVGLVVRNPEVGPLGPLGIAAVLAAMIYAGGHVSGAHYNPAVSLAIRARGRLEGRDLVSYWIFQLLGAGLAIWLVSWLRPDGMVAELRQEVATVLVGEGVFTFALAWVVLHVATARANSGNSYFGLAIGLTVLAGAVAVGDLTGGAFNPAVTVALAQLGLIAWAAVPWYLGAQLVAGVLAAVAFRFTSPE